MGIASRQIGAAAAQNSCVFGRDGADARAAERNGRTGRSAGRHATAAAPYDPVVARNAVPPAESRNTPSSGVT